jgi:hypothetical protein
MSSHTAWSRCFIGKYDAVFFGRQAIRLSKNERAVTPEPPDLWTLKRKVLDYIAEAKRRNKPFTFHLNVDLAVQLFEYGWTPGDSYTVKDETDCHCKSGVLVIPQGGWQYFVHSTCNTESGGTWDNQE